MTVGETELSTLAERSSFRHGWMSGIALVIEPFIHPRIKLRSACSVQMIGSRGPLDGPDQVDALQSNYLTTPAVVRRIGKTRHQHAERFGILFCGCESRATVDGGGCKIAYLAARAASMDPITSGASGAVRGSKRLIMAPSRPIRNLPKFHLMSPGNGESFPASWM